MTRYVCDKCNKVFNEDKILIEGHYGSGVLFYCDDCWKIEQEKRKTYLELPWYKR